MIYVLGQELAVKLSHVNNELHLHLYCFNIKLCFIWVGLENNE